MTLSAPAGWRNDGADAWRKIPPCCDCPGAISYDAMDEIDAFGWDEADDAPDDDDLDEWIDEPELVPVPVPQPLPPVGIPVEWPTRIVQPVPLSRR